MGKIFNTFSYFELLVVQFCVHEISEKLRFFGVKKSANAPPLTLMDIQFLAKIFIGISLFTLMDIHFL